MGLAVAVITSCYNQEKFVPEAIESVIEQTAGVDIYHVIADDGSDDRSAAVLYEWEARHDHIRVVECTNRNVGGAFNAALLNVPADADYIVTLAGDDWLAPNFVEACLDVFFNQRHDVVDMVVPGMKRVGYPGQNGSLEMPRQRQPTQSRFGHGSGPPRVLRLSG